MIQVLNYSGRDTTFKGNDVVTRSIATPESLDSFDINIIDFTDSELWESNSSTIGKVNSEKDLRNLEEMITQSKKTKIIKIFPQDLLYYYHYTYNDNGEEGFTQKENLKNMLEKVWSIIMVGLPSSTNILRYENTMTMINSKQISATFYFSNDEKVLTQSKDSKKATTIRLGKQVLTTLKVRSLDDLVDLLKEINLLKEDEVAPEWMREIKMFDDAKQLEIIQENNNIIAKSQANIKCARDVLGKNNRYKSILYTTGNELVNVVLEILQEMLGCDFSNFQDMKKEDFLTVIDEEVFIGEIKGVNHNVKSENISQLDVHYQGYLEDNPEINPQKVHALLIMDHQKNKPLINREPVHERQITLAKRNGSLIIETHTLLRIFEKYTNGEMLRKECISILSGNTGLLTMQ